jgi:hypothetical protein
MMRRGSKSGLEKIEEYLNGVGRRRKVVDRSGATKLKRRRMDDYGQKWVLEI